MNFSDKVKDLLEKSIDSSREFINKAGSQAQAWSEMGKIKIEILQLRSRAQSAISKLGAETYSLLVEKGEPMIGTHSEGISSLIEQIKKLEADIDTKEAAYRAAGGKEADLDGDGRPG